MQGPSGNPTESYFSVNVPVLNYIEPPREILKGANRPNCLFTK